MPQTGSRKRGRPTASSVDSDQPSKAKKVTTTKQTTRSTKDLALGKGLGKNGVHGNARAAKHGRKGATDAINEIRAKGDEVFLIINDERSKPTDGHGSSRAGGSLADSLANEYALRSHDPITGCEAFEEAKRALQRFRSLASRYDVAGSHEPGPAEPRWMRWKQDVVDLTALNGKARKLARQIAEGHLAPAGWPPLAVPSPGTGDEELAQIAMEILDEAVPDGKVTWGSAAAQLINVYGSVLKDTF